MIPFLSESLTVSKALDALKQRGRSGMVVESPAHGYRVLFTGDLLQARASRISRVAAIELPADRTCVLLDMPQARRYGVDLVRPWKTSGKFSKLLTQLNTEFALAGVTSDTVMIVSARETWVEAMNMTSGYECTGTPTHYFPEPRVRPNQRCPRYPLCSLPGGGVPTIRPSS
jgi:hypothetical protein